MLTSLVHAIMSRGVLGHPIRAGIGKATRCPHHQVKNEPPFCLLYGYVDVASMAMSDSQMYTLRCSF